MTDSINIRSIWSFLYYINKKVWSASLSVNPRLPLFDRSHLHLALASPPCHLLSSSRLSGCWGHSKRQKPPHKEEQLDLLVMTLPVREARKPTLTSTRVMRRPLLWRCSVTTMSSPTAPWTKSEEKRHHRNTQYHISDGETEHNTHQRSAYVQS